MLIPQKKYNVRHFDFLNWLATWEECIIQFRSVKFYLINSVDKLKWNILNKHNSKETWLHFTKFNADVLWLYIGYSKLLTKSKIFNYFQLRFNYLNDKKGSLKFINGI